MYVIARYDSHMWRIRREFAVALALTLTSNDGARGQDPLQDLPALPPALGTPTKNDDPRMLKSRFAPMVSNPIEPEELRSYALILNLSDAQRTILRDQYLAYRTATDALYAKYGERDMELAFEAADTQKHPNDWEFLRLYTELRSIEDEFQKHLVQQDKAFLAAVRAILAEPQIERFERVTLRRDRKRCLPYNIDLSPAYIDLVILCETYVKDPDVLGDLHSVLLAYERLITPHYRAIDEKKQHAVLEEIRESVAANYSDDGKNRLAPDDPIRKARGPAARQTRLTRLAATMPQQERLAAINREYLAKVLAIVKGDEHEAIEREYLRQEYPAVYPDQNDPTRLMQRMLDVKGLDPDLRTLMQTRMESWRTEYGRIASEMERLYLEYNENFARTSSSGREPTATIRRLRFERWECSEKAVGAMQAMLPVDIKATFDKQVESYTNRLNSEREKNLRRGNP